MNDRLQQLALFVRTVESGSFSKTAREFGLSQPSVSRTIAALERRLGVKLLIRTTRQVSATDAGEALLARARDALLAIDEAESAARGADRLSGVLRVALPPEYGVRRIVPLAAGVLRPASAPQDRSHDVGSLREFDRRRGGPCAANRRPPGFELRRAQARELEAPVHRRAILSRAPRRARQASPTLLGHDVISGPADTGDETWAARRNGRIERQALSPRVRSRSATGVVACAVAGLGHRHGSIWMCADALASGEVVEILADYALDPVTAYVVFPAGRRPSQRARAFSDYLEQALAAIAEERGRRAPRATPPQRAGQRSQPLRKA